MTSLATVFGLIPMALKLGTGSEAYAPLARAIIGGLLVSVVADGRSSCRRPTCWSTGGAPQCVARASALDRRVARLCAACDGGGARPRRRARPSDAAGSGAAGAASATRRSRAGTHTALAAGETDPRGAFGLLSDGRSAASPAPAHRDGTRIAAGGLNNPTILDRFATGIAVSQLVTDFGRTQRPRARARRSTPSRADKDVDARRADVLLQVDRAYFDALRAQAVLRVAQQTVRRAADWSPIRFRRSPTAT